MPRRRDKVVCILSWTCLDHIPTSRRTYENVKEVVLEVGEYSVFQATENMKTARIFDRLERDPELEIKRLGFPWIAVRYRPGPSGEAA